MSASIKALVIAFLLGSSFAFAQTGWPTWPGQSGNAVGFAAAPGWTGSFNATACPAQSSGSSWSSPAIIQNCTYSTAQTITCSYCEFIFVDFNNGSGQTYINGGNHIIFYGVRFQGNCPGCSGNVSISGSYLYFFWSSSTPLASAYTSPPGSAWPSAGAGANSTTITSGVNATPGANSINDGFVINSGAYTYIYLDHCDIWGFGHGIQMQNSLTGPIWITSTWIHDAADPSTYSYHTDGIGYETGSAGPNNLTVIGNTVATLGSDQALALQAATSGYQGLHIHENFWSGDSTTIDFGFGPASTVWPTNSAFYGNLYGTDLKNSGTIYSPGSALQASTVWQCNRIEFLAGTTWTNGDSWTPTSAMNNQFLLMTNPPNSASDTGSNTFCGITAPAAINFGNQSSGSTSAGQTITYTSTNTGTLSISSVALAGGTDFTITSNTCGSTLASGTNCAITVKFAPSSMGPKSDTLQITSNTPGVSSPQLVPLLGIGTAAGSSPTVAPAPSMMLAKSLADRERPQAVTIASQGAAK